MQKSAVLYTHSSCYLAPMQSSHHKTLLSHHSYLQSFRAHMMDLEVLVYEQYLVEEGHCYITPHE